MSKKCQNEYRTKLVNSKDCPSKTPRLYRSNPWHLISFKDFISYLVKQNQINVDTHFSPIASRVQTGATRNPCHFNYTAIIKVQYLKSELKFIFEQNQQFELPPGTHYYCYFIYLSFTRI